MKKILSIFTACFVMLMILLFSLPDAEIINAEEEAVSLNITLKNSNGSSTAALRDKKYDTTVQYKSGDYVTISSETPMAGIYIIWGSKVSPWNLSCGSKRTEYGKNGFLHEYIALDTEVRECTIELNDDVRISDIYAYSKGILPDDVQVWEPSCKKADILVFSTHADDEILFLGGVLTTYGGGRGLGVQVVYMTNYWNGARIREHEKLDGIWTCGVKNYPVNMPYDDLYAKDLAGAQKVYDEEMITSSVTEAIRMFKPQIVVTQDLNGEYGHGGHMLLAKCVCTAVDNSSKAEFCQESSKAYDTWDVPKTYLHLYADNKLKLDLRQPLEGLNNQTALDVAKAAYKKHVSQQWCWFYVSDEYEYSCNDFGLYRTIVGSDTGKGDMMENLTSYAEQDRIAQEKAEAEALLTKAAEEEQARKNAALTQAALDKGSNESSKDSSTADKPKDNDNNPTTILIIILVILILAAAIYFYLTISRLNKKKRLLEQKRRQAGRRQSNRRPVPAANAGKRQSVPKRNTGNSGRPSDKSRASYGTAPASGLKTNRAKPPVSHSRRKASDGIKKDYRNR